MDNGYFGERVDGDILIPALRSYGHLIVLTLLMMVMFLTRVMGYEKYITDEGVLLRGSDPWYHYRETAYIVERFPQTLPIDPFTGYPIGGSAGEYGTLFDQALATIALLIGGGTPSDTTILLVLLFVPPLVGTLVAIPVYLLGKRIAGGCRWTGVAAVGLLSLFPGVFFEQSLVGAADHHVAEVFFLTCATVAFLFALAAARTELPIYEAVRDDPSSARQSLQWSALTGVFVALFMGVWPPGVAFVGIIGVFLVAYTMVSVAVEETAEPVLVVGGVSMGVAGVLTLLQIDMIGFDVTHLSLTQVLLPLAVTVGCVFLTVLGRLVETRETIRFEFPLVVGIALIGVFGALSLFAPDTVDLFREYIIRGVGLGIHADELRTVRDAQPVTARGGTNYLFAQYGAIIGVSVLGFLALVYRGLRRRSSEALFLTVWTLFLGLAAMTQVKYNYYLAVVVAILAAYAFRIVVNQLDIPRTTVPREFAAELRGYQVLIVLFIIMTVIPILVFPMSGTVFAAMGAHEPTEYQQWDASLDWFNENTPPVGELEGETNAVEYHGEYDTTDRFDYPAGAYGVLSWTKYGHWITTGAERPAVANPFPQHAEVAAQYLLATDEKEARHALDGLDEDADTRYLMVDWKMASPDAEFLRPVAHHPETDVGEYTTALYMDGGENNGGQLEYATHVKSQAYYESLMVRLYNYHGSAVDPEPIVVNYETSSPQGTAEELRTVPTNRQLVEYYNTVAEAQDAAAADPTAQVGGIGTNPEERVEALEHYRLVHASDASATEDSRYAQLSQRNALLAGMSPDMVRPEHPAWVKTFERVPGATIEGTAPAESTVRATVDVQMPNGEQTFTYTAYADTDSEGHFEMTVPYSTTGVDKWGPDEGYTDTDVVGTEPYQFETVVEESVEGEDTRRLTRWSDEAQVSEGQVIGEDSTPIVVELEEQETSTVPAGENPVGADGEGDTGSHAQTEE